MIFSCGSTCVEQAIFRSYGRYFAEFLEDLSLVRLGLLALITCVGLRYGFSIDKFRRFSWKRAPLDQIQPRLPLFYYARIMLCGFAYRTSSRHKPQSNKGPKVQHSVPPSLNTEVREY
jgi:hypothetical protein